VTGRQPWSFGAEYADVRANEVRAALSAWLSMDAGVILDVGGGDGALAIGLRAGSARVVCLDIDTERLGVGHAEARRRGIPASYVVADVTVLPIAARTCDVVLLYGIVELLPRPDLLVRETGRVLTDHGVAYLVVPNPLSPRTILDDPHAHLPLTHLLPPGVARWYAHRLMRRNVKELGEHFALPSYGALRRMFAAAGLRLQLVSNLMRIEDPALVISPGKRRVARWLRRLGLARWGRTLVGRALLHLYDRWLARSWSFIVTRES